MLTLLGVFGAGITNEGYAQGEEGKNECKENGFGTIIHSRLLLVDNVRVVKDQVELVKKEYKKAIKLSGFLWITFPIQCKIPRLNAMKSMGQVYSIKLSVEQNKDTIFQDLSGF